MLYSITRTRKTRIYLWRVNNMEKTMITASAVLTKVESLIKELKEVQGSWEKGYDHRDRYIRTSWKNNRYAFRMDAVYDDLSIFDWWNDTLSIHQLEDMKKFLKEAIKLGYDGYVCFKVGATGCANGMWAHKELSTTGYSPDGACIYKSFTPDYNYWSITLDGTKWFPESNDNHKGYDALKTIKDFEKFIEENC